MNVDVSVVGANGLFANQGFIGVGFAGKSVRYVYNNPLELEDFSKVYNADTFGNRCDFLEELSRKGYTPYTVPSLRFSTMMGDSEMLYVENI